MAKPTLIARIVGDAPPLPPETYRQEPALSLEDDIRALATARPARRSVGNSADMNRIEELLSNGVTAAHEDACAALDKVVEEARSLMERAEAAAESHKSKLRAEGQRIAITLAAAVQELTRTVEWVEKQGPALRNPQLDPPPKDVTYADAKDNDPAA